MADLLHWHRMYGLPGPSTYAEPPPCCVDAVGVVLERAVSYAARDERVRIVRESVERLDAYLEGVLAARDPASAKLIEAVGNRCRDIIRAVGCVCPQVDVSTLGEGPGTRTMPGYDPLCGVHDRPSPVAQRARECTCQELDVSSGVGPQAGVRRVERGLRDPDCPFHGKAVAEGEAVSRQHRASPP